MKKLVILFLFFLSFFIARPVFASSSYVLPYPSVMPGGLNYKIHVLFERLQKYWYFGDFGQYSYNLKEADKYLVEAKTLFEYQQYLLGYKALQESDWYFKDIYPNLLSAKDHKKNILQKKEELKSASEKHIEVLFGLIQVLPKEVIWSPEKSQPVTLELKKALEESIKIRGDISVKL